MNIYFTASTTNDGLFKKNHIEILNKLAELGHVIISGNQIVNDELLKKDAILTKEQIFKREKELIEKADCIIAEVSQPSLGVGGEIVYALIKEKPVLGLVFENGEDKISPMIVGNPSENLFLENYDFSRLPYVLNEFLEHVVKISKRKGYLIVIDGGDGSGKSTQAKLLVDILKKEIVPVKYVDFPQYYSSFHGKTVARFLRGEFGTIDQVSPYLASLAYAVDRASIKKEMDDFLSKGGYIIANRYATSSMVYQAAKFKDIKQQEELIKWNYELEYKVHKIPKENIVIYLYVPWQIGVELTNTRKNKKYLKGLSQDIHEKSMEYRQDVEKMYLKLAKRYKHWITINCVENNKILSEQIIHNKIMNILSEKNILQNI
ncbi:MAG: hypothetical protein Q7R95_02535 [bacterium]|nr:hypothetical protein [bacterium]